MDQIRTEFLRCLLPVRMIFRIFALVVIGSIVSEAISADTSRSDKSSLPARWTVEWANPSPDMRPLQIIHGHKLDEKQVLYYRDTCGLGGLVINVPYSNGYVRNDANWKEFVENVKLARAANLRIWIYDEQGWPSLSAGGAVLEKNPNVESLELVNDPGAQPEFYVRPSYEYTFASMDTLRTARRHPNPLDPAATQTFLEVTHRRYQKELGPDLYRQIEAFFTDEPTLLAFSILRILTPEERNKYGVTDPLDWTKKQLAAVPWCNGMKQKFKSKYGRELEPNLKSLFAGSSENDKAIRQQFWQLVGEINADSYFGGLRRFCEETPNGPVASGHTLAEEGLILHVPIDGNKLSVLKQFQLPGQDLLNSDPKAQLTHYWSTNAFPASAAMLIGERKIMTEISDHIQRHAEVPRLCTLNEMESAAAVMASWGITEFTLYYSSNGGSQFPYRTEETHKKYSDFVGKLNAILRNAESIRPVLLYYPIELMQQEYIPQKGHFQSHLQSQKLQDITAAFIRTGGALTRAQIPFIIVDDESIRELIANGRADKPQTAIKSRTVRNDTEFSGIVYPAGVPQKKYDWNNNMPEIHGDQLPGIIHAPGALKEVGPVAGPRLVLDPPSQEMALGTFYREGRLIFLVSNTGNDYQGKFNVDCGNRTVLTNGHFHFEKNPLPKEKRFTPNQGDWTVMNPGNGHISTLSPETGTNTVLSLKIGKGETLILVSP